MPAAERPKPMHVRRLKPFVSDGCSLFPDGDWRDCCVEHDRAYHKGGTGQERLAADRALRRCVAARGHPVVAWIMYRGVRLGGLSVLPTPFRWGFGHKWPRSHRRKTGS